MEHFLQFCSLNVHNWDLLASKLRVTLLCGQTDGLLDFLLFQTPEDLAVIWIRHLPCIFFENLAVVNTVILYYLLQSCCSSLSSGTSDTPATLVHTTVQLFSCWQWWRKIKQIQWNSGQHGDLTCWTDRLVFRTKSLGWGRYGYLLFVSVICPDCDCIFGLCSEVFF